MPDIKTLMLLYIIINIISAGAVAVIWQQNRGRFAGISFWLTDMILQSAGSVLIVMRGVVPDLISMTLSNTMIMAGALIMLMGLERFTGKKGWQGHNYVLLAVFIAVHAYFVAVYPNLAAREIAISAIIMVYTFQCCWLLLRRVVPGLRQFTRLTGIVFAGYAAVNFARIIVTVVLPSQGNDFFKAGAIDALAITLYITLGVCLTISLVLMVSKRLLVEVQLQEEKFNAAFHSSPYAITLTRVADGRIFEVNDGFYDMTGYQPDEVTGKTTLGLHLWANEEDRISVVRELSKGNTLRGVEYQFHKKTGEVITGLFSASIITVNNEQCVVASIGDITERKQAEVALGESEERYRAIFAESPIAIELYDKAGALMAVNASALKLFGVATQDELKGFNLFEDPNVSEEYKKRLKNGKVVRYEAAFDFEIVRKLKLYATTKKGTIWLDILITPLGKPTGGYLAQVQDITTRKQAEKLLRESEEKYRTVVDHGHDLIVIAQDGMMKFVNPRAVEITGYTREELTSKPFIGFIHPDDRDYVIERHVKRLNDEEAPFEYELRFMDSRGNSLLLELNAVVIEYEGRPATLNFLRDITEKRRMEEERQKLDKLESVGTLAGGIAHDFNNALAAIIGSISLAGAMVPPGGEADELLESAEKAALKARDLTQQLLTFAKGGAPVRKVTELGPMIKDTATFALRGSESVCRFDIQPGLRAANVDLGQIGQVISNLVINARQAIPAGGVIDISARNITLTGDQALGRTLPLAEGEYVRISVADTGCGIPADNLDKIFDPYFTTKQTGNGLGLAICYSILRNHGGHISVESTTGEGATFNVYLPASDRPVEAAPGPIAKAPAPSAAKLLVMDDEANIREVTGRLLKFLGYKDVAFAADGEETVKLYGDALEAGHPFDVVILDFTVPGKMGGLEAVRRLRELDAGVKAIIASGYAEAPVMSDFSAHGFKAALAKPFSMGQLSEALVLALGGSDLSP